MIWTFFWGVVTGVGIMFVGTLLGVALYGALRTDIINQLEAKEENK